MRGPVCRIARYVGTWCLWLSATAGLQAAEADASPAPPAAPRQSSSASTLTYYLDAREYSTISLAASRRALPLGLDVWGFVDLHGDQDASGQWLDSTRYFMEYRLRRPLSPQWTAGIRGLAAEMEYNDFRGPDNRAVRAGITYRHSLDAVHARGSWLQWRAHPYETDGSGWQASVIYYLKISARISVSGFADLNVETDSPNRWVAEPQVNIRVSDAFDVVVEGRYNGYEDASPSLDGVGVALGVRVKP